MRIKVSTIKQLIREAVLNNPLEDIERDPFSAKRDMDYSFGDDALGQDPFCTDCGTSFEADDSLRSDVDGSRCWGCADQGLDNRADTRGDPYFYADRDDEIIDEARILSNVDIPAIVDISEEEPTIGFDEEEALDALDRDLEYDDYYQRRAKRPHDVTALDDDDLYRAKAHGMSDEEMKELVFAIGRNSGRRGI